MTKAAKMLGRPGWMEAGSAVRLKDPFRPQVVGTEGIRLKERVSLLLAVKKMGMGLVGFDGPTYRRTLDQAYADWKGFTHGTVVQVGSREAKTQKPSSVTLHLYDPEIGVVWLWGGEVPVEADYDPKELTWMQPEKAE